MHSLGATGVQHTRHKDDGKAQGTPSDTRDVSTTPPRIWGGFCSPTTLTIWIQAGLCLQAHGLGSKRQRQGRGQPVSPSPSPRILARSAPSGQDINPGTAERCQPSPTSQPGRWAALVADSCVEQHEMAAADRSCAAPAQLDTDKDTARSHPHAPGLNTGAKSEVLKAWRGPRGEQPRAAGPDKGQGTSPSLRPKGCGAAGNSFSQGEQFPMSLAPPRKRPWEGQCPPACP